MREGCKLGRKIACLVMTVASCASGGSFVSKRREEVIVKDLRGLPSERVPKRVTEKIKVENEAGRC